MSKEWATQELLKRYFEDNPKVEYRRGNIDKPLLWEYEKEIGKPLLDMDRNEMVELIFRYAKGTAKYQPYISPTTVDSISSIIRTMLDWYSMNGNKKYNNVLKDSSISKSHSILWLVVNKAGRITYQDFQNIVMKLHNDFMINYSVNVLDYTRADYLELLMLLFYSGFAESQEIIELTEIDIKNKICELPDRIITLTDRTFELLTAFHHQGSIAIPNGNAVIQHPLCSWHNSYLKFVVQAGKVDKFNDKSAYTIRTLISHNIQFWVGDKYSTGICANSLYWLGVHDRLVALFGEEELSKMIVSSDSKNDQHLYKAWKNETHRKSFNEFKRCLWQFIDPKVPLIEM